MNYNALLVFGFTTLAVVFAIAIILNKFRHAFIVPEGYVGLLYHKGRFVETLGAGQQCCNTSMNSCP